MIHDAGAGDAAEKGPERTALPGRVEPGQDAAQRDEGFLGGVGGLLVGQAGAAGARIDQFPVQIDEGLPGQFPAALAEAGEERGVGDAGVGGGRRRAGGLGNRLGNLTTQAGLGRAEGQGDPRRMRLWREHGIGMEEIVGVGDP